MIKTIYTCISIVFILIMVSCSTGKKALQKGDYYRATMESVNRLRSSPDNKKAQQVLKQSYPLAQSSKLRNIQNSMDVNQPNKYAVIVQEYTDLNDLANAIYACPKALEIIPNPTQYYSELKRAKELAAEESYKLGVVALSQNTILKAREAYYHFKDADTYVNNYKDVAKKLQEALFLATLKVVVSKPVTSAKYQLTADFFYDNLMAQMSKVTSYNFIRFYTYEEAKNENLRQPDQYIILDFNDFSVGNIRESKSTTEISKDSVLVGTTKINGTNHNVYGTVKAQFTVFRREVISGGVLNVRIIDAYNNRTLENKNFPGQFVWYNEWATYKGDERALTSKQLQMTNNSDAVMPPANQDLFIEFTKPIFDQTVSFVRSYYAR
ncbi:MAG: hypothetical protein QM751_10805 [Paludibacteraceae bacterium]